MKKISIILVFSLVISLLIVGSVFAVSFTDIPDDAYYADAAERMADKGILSGFGDGRFYGDWELTRAQFAALACKLLGKVDEATALAGKTAFADVYESHWSTGYVNYAVANKIINGDGDGNFRPDDPVKYEEAIKVIICVLQPDNNIVIDSTDWAKNFIAEAEKLGLTDNLIGQKGEFMKRSDIAVIADAAMAILENRGEDTSVETTTEKVSDFEPSQTATPAETTAEPVETTAEHAETEKPAIVRPEHVPSQWETPDL
ncbi:MAG: S-layer homology domain-containing protein [Clostridia bacterium]|nr:S-layer homology domain-containing protein [Clostridia bacterium]